MVSKIDKIYLQRGIFMRLQHYKHLISCFLAVILFVSGMCVEITDADSYFASQIPQQTQTSQYQSSEYTSFISSDYCTPELMQANQSRYIRNDKTNSLRSSKNRATNPITFITNNHLIYFEEHLLTGVPPTTFSRIIIINYMHLQDGDK